MLQILQRHVGRLMRLFGENIPPHNSLRCQDSEEEESLSDSTDSPLDISDSDSQSSGSGEDSGHASRRGIMQLLGSIRLAITSLYQLQIRKPAPIDRLKDKYTEDARYYQHFDTMHVREKFGNLDEQVVASLGKMITRRRALLHYRKAHQRHIRDKKHNLLKELSGIPTTTDQSSSQESALKRNRNLLSGAPRSIADRSSWTGDTQSEITKRALTVIPYPELSVDLLRPSTEDDGESITSDVASAFTLESPVKLPPRPRNDEGVFKTSFECNYCSLAVHIQTEQAWK